MAKFHGMIGYIKTEETAPGVHTEVVTERLYNGDILRNNQSWENSEHLNDNFTITNRFSIVTDQFAYENFPYIRYITYIGTKWKVDSIEIVRPRMIISVKGVYNG